MQWRPSRAGIAFIVVMTAVAVVVAVSGVLATDDAGQVDQGLDRLLQVLWVGSLVVLFPMSLLVILVEAVIIPVAAITDNLGVSVVVIPAAVAAAAYLQSVVTFAAIGEKLRERRRERGDTPG